MPRPPLCRGLDLLNLDGLEIDDALLGKMEKWNCLREDQADKLLETKKTKGNALDSMMQFLNKRGPRKWCYLVCVFLEVGHDEFAKKSWQAVLQHITFERKMGEKRRKEALDLWDEFVRCMLTNLVPNQRKVCTQTAGGPAVLEPLGKKQQETASEIWESIVKAADEVAYRSKEDLHMWMILINAMSNSDLQNAPGPWKEQMEKLMRVLEAGERECCRYMCEYLLQQVKVNKMNDIQKLMIGFMLKAAASKQKTFVRDIVDVLIKHFWQVARRDWKPAIRVFELLGDSIVSLIDGDAVQDALWLHEALCVEIQRLPKQLHQHCLDLLCEQIQGLNYEEKADKTTLKKMRDALPSSPTSPRSTTTCDDGDLQFKSHVQPNVRYPFSPESNSMALVINNVDFKGDDQVKPRIGSDMDELAMSSLLKKVGFHVKETTNLTKDGLLQEIKAFAQRPEHEHADAAVLVVMTHGADEALLGSDGQMLSFQAVIDCFSNENAPNLAGKPKWIGFHACRTQGDKGCVTSNSETTDDLEEGTLADIFITYTACSGREALRHVRQGTFYVQAIKRILDTPQGNQLSLFEIHMEAQKILSDIWKDQGLQEKELDKPTLEVRAIGWSRKLCFAVRSAAQVADSASQTDDPPVATPPLAPDDGSQTDAPRRLPLV